MSAALQCAGLGHRYGRRLWGLRDCDLDVPAGRVVALVGPNGSGKTTLMSMAAGLLPATAGTVEAAGGAPAQRLNRIGFVAQDAPLWPRLRVADVLEVGRCMNRGFDAVMAAERIRQLGIRPRARISALSGGERAQVALTLVLAKKPELFLLDEPMANLDPLARREFLDSMFGACQETGATVLYSSHAVAELERVCDFLIVHQLTAGDTASSRWSWFASVNLAPAGEAMLVFALAVASGALLRRTLPAIGAAVAGFTVLLLAARWAVQALTPASRTTGPRFTAPPGSWLLGSGTSAPVPYHPVAQYWPLQLILLTVLLALAAAALATGWHATRTRTV